MLQEKYQNNQNRTPRSNSTNRQQRMSKNKTLYKDLLSNNDHLNYELLNSQNSSISQLNSVFSSPSNPNKVKGRRQTSTVSSSISANTYKQRVTSFICDALHSGFLSVGHSVYDYNLSSGSPIIDELLNLTPSEELILHMVLYDNNDNPPSLLILTSKGRLLQYNTSTKMVTIQLESSPIFIPTIYDLELRDRILKLGSVLQKIKDKSSQNQLSQNWGKNIQQQSKSPTKSIKIQKCIMILSSASKLTIIKISNSSLHSRGRPPIPFIINTKFQSAIIEYFYLEKDSYLICNEDKEILVVSATQRLSKLDDCNQRDLEFVKLSNGITNRQDCLSCGELNKSKNLGFFGSYFEDEIEPAFIYITSISRGQRSSVNLLCLIPLQEWQQTVISSIRLVSSIRNKETIGEVEEIALISQFSGKFHAFYQHSIVSTQNKDPNSSLELRVEMRSKASNSSGCELLFNSHSQIHSHPFLDKSGWIMFIDSRSNFTISRIFPRSMFYDTSRKMVKRDGNIVEDDIDEQSELDISSSNLSKNSILNTRYSRIVITPGNNSSQDSLFSQLNDTESLTQSSFDLKKYLFSRSVVTKGQIEQQMKQFDESDTLRPEYHNLNNEFIPWDRCQQDTTQFTQQKTKNNKNKGHLAMIAKHLKINYIEQSKISNTLSTPRSILRNGKRKRSNIRRNSKVVIEGSNLFNKSTNFDEKSKLAKSEYLNNDSSEQGKEVWSIKNIKNKSIDNSDPVIGASAHKNSFGSDSINPFDVLGTSDDSMLNTKNIPVNGGVRKPNSSLKSKGFKEFKKQSTKLNIINTIKNTQKRKRKKKKNITFIDKILANTEHVVPMDTELLNPISLVPCSSSQGFIAVANPNPSLHLYTIDFQNNKVDTKMVVEGRLFSSGVFLSSQDMAVFHCETDQQFHGFKVGGGLGNFFNLCASRYKNMDTLKRGFILPDNEELILVNEYHKLSVFKVAENSFTSTKVSIKFQSKEEIGGCLTFQDDIVIMASISGKIEVHKYSSKSSSLLSSSSLPLLTEEQIIEEGRIERVTSVDLSEDETHIVVATVLDSKDKKTNMLSRLVVFEIRKDNGLDIRAQHWYGSELDGVNSEYGKIKFGHKIGNLRIITCLQRGGAKRLDLFQFTLNKTISKVEGFDKFNKSRVNAFGEWNKHTISVDKLGRMKIFELFK